MGARQAEGLSPWSRRAPQESDRYPKDFCPFSGRLFEVGVFPPIFFTLVEIGLNVRSQIRGNLARKKAIFECSTLGKSIKPCPISKKNKKKGWVCPVSKTVGKIARTHLRSGGNSRAGR